MRRDPKLSNLGGEKGSRRGAERAKLGREAESHLSNARGLYTVIAVLHVYIYSFIRNGKELLTVLKEKSDTLRVTFGDN